MAPSSDDRGSRLSFENVVLFESTPSLVPLFFMAPSKEDRGSAISVLLLFLMAPSRNERGSGVPFEAKAPLGSTSILLTALCSDDRRLELPTKDETPHDSAPSSFPLLLIAPSSDDRGSKLAPIVLATFTLPLFSMAPSREERGSELFPEDKMLLEESSTSTRTVPSGEGSLLPSEPDAAIIFVSPVFPLLLIAPRSDDRGSELFSGSKA
mmetsp:Transcript_47255/g.92172  ORF Transcript_47255/g.92172 Transcript_47255/m.92172 type:complete len:210 (-) Transcript_47255:3569-4198(-)